VSISSTLYARVFHTNVVSAAFLVTCTLCVRGKSCESAFVQKISTQKCWWNWHLAYFTICRPNFLIVLVSQDLLSFFTSYHDFIVAAKFSLLTKTKSCFFAKFHEIFSKVGLLLHNQHSDIINSYVLRLKMCLYFNFDCGSFNHSLKQNIRPLMGTFYLLISKFYVT